MCFGIDILVTFNTSYSETDSLIEVTDRKKIAYNYLKSWLTIDLISIFPFELIFGKNLSAVAKFARIGRLYKLIRMTRLAKLFKLIKTQKTIVT